jgi:hypothetical protein
MYTSRRAVCPRLPFHQCRSTLTVIRYSTHAAEVNIGDLAVTSACLSRGRVEPSAAAAHPAMTDHDDPGRTAACRPPVPPGCCLRSASY